MSLNIAINYSNNSQSGARNANSNMLMWAVMCSILLHILLAFVIPNLKFDATKNPELFVVELSKKPEPPPVVIPEPVKAEADAIKPKIEPKSKPKPITKPLPATAALKNEPAPYVSPPEVVTHQTEVIAVAPKADAAPSPASPTPAAVPESQKSDSVNQEDLDNARGKYGNTLWGIIGKQKKYPRSALMRGWEGEAIVELLLDGNGKLKSKKIIQSSGFESLDKQALEMVEKAAPFPAPPEALRGNNFSIKVPIPFKLEPQQ